MGNIPWGTTEEQLHQIFSVRTFQQSLRGRKSFVSITRSRTSHRLHTCIHSSYEYRVLLNRQDTSKCACCTKDGSATDEGNSLRPGCLQCNQDRSRLKKTSRLLPPTFDRLHAANIESLAVRMHLVCRMTAVYRELGVSGDVVDRLRRPTYCFELVKIEYPTHRRSLCFLGSESLNSFTLDGFCSTGSWWRGKHSPGVGS